MTHRAEAEEDRAQSFSVFQAWWATHASVQETSMRYGHPLGFLPDLGVPGLHLAGRAPMQVASGGIHPGQLTHLFMALAHRCSCAWAASAGS